MNRFILHQRVSVRAVEANGGIVALFSGRPAKVVRIRRCDNGAWAELDERDLLNIHPFPVGDPRERHVLTYPEWCDEIKAGGK